MNKIPTEICASCGSPIFKASLIDMTTGDPQTLCARCASQLSKCFTCVQRNICAFESDPSPLPKTVQRQIRSGNMVTIQEVPNPARVVETCLKSCNCYSKEFEACCAREFEFCANYKPIWEKGE